ncbi:Golgi-associated plant pathogenesis-related protein 1 [Lucilia cuprina]|nr:Golgi-associated plant pathogenesis-related protein 1 [Lucilia cuprina]
MFSWCFKCQTADDDDYHQRPKTRNTSANKSQRVSYTAVPIPTTTNESEASKKSVEQLQLEVLEAHNRYRAKHGVSPLTLSKQLCAFATEWAKHLADSNSLQHRKNNKYGENLYIGTGMGPQTHELAVQAWYDEIKNYNFNKPGFSSNTGHFTQVVWKTSKELGVGIVNRANRTWVVCNYDPAGNVMGNYMDCVPPLVEHTVAKIIDKMKGPKKNIFKRPPKQQELKDDKEETPAKAATHSASDLKLWSKYELECLDSHNKYRALHGSPAMKLNRNLCNLAQDWSNKLAKRNSISHRPQNEYGENIYYCVNMEATAEQCVKSWYDEIKHYNFSKPGFSSQTGHFTQVVWKDSLELGVGIAKANNTTFVVCNYSPAGNVMSQYKDQVPRPGAKPTASKHKNNTANSAGSSSSIVQATTIKDQPTFEEICLDSHNNFRAIHGAPAMSINKNLSVFASDWAQHLATHNKIMNRTNNRYGENLFYANDQVLEGHEPVEFWYSGIDDYNYQNPGYIAASASFTQVVWKNSQELGVGVAKVGRSTYVVCNYNPKGNIKDEFAENVLKVGGERVVMFDKHRVPEKVDNFAENILKSHNNYRAKHGCPMLQLSQELMDYCEMYTELLIDNKPCPETPQYAISITYFPEVIPSADEIVSNWYNEIVNYDFQNPKFNEDSKHFTQIIWKNTKFMGVAVRKSDENSIVAIRYEPSGNRENQYAENVPPAI